MEIGLALPQFDFSVPDERPLRWDTVLQWATRAEALGFDSLWVADHLFLSIEKYGGPPGEHGCFDPIVLLAALARATSRVRLGTLVLCAPLRAPAIVAHSLATLDVMSRGRVTIGLGAGWYEREFEAAGIRFERPGVRLRQLAEVIEIVRRLLEGDTLSFAGRHYQVRDIRIRPAAVQHPHPPIWVGGSGDRLLQLCAGHADGWNTVWRWTHDAFAARARALDAACERVGRDPLSVTRSVGLYALVGESRSDLARRYEQLQRAAPAGVLDGVPLAEWREGRLVGTVEEVRDQLRRWEALGVSSLILGPGALPFSVAGGDDVEMLAAACSLEAP